MCQQAAFYTHAPQHYNLHHLSHERHCSYCFDSIFSMMIRCPSKEMDTVLSSGVTPICCAHIDGTLPPYFGPPSFKKFWKEAIKTV